MRLRLGWLITLLMVIVSTAVLLRQQQVSPNPQRSPMELSSTAFQENEIIPAQYTCDGQDVSPPLSIAGVPTATQSLALIVDDPDAPGGDWVHWVVWNIDPTTVSFNEGIVPVGATEGQTDFDRPGYGGPCPPFGVHRYQFKLYALDTALTIPPTSHKASLEEAMRGHILAEAMLVGRYQRL